MWDFLVIMKAQDNICMCIKKVIKGNQTQMSNKKREALIYKVSRSLASAEKGT